MERFHEAALEPLQQVQRLGRAGRCVVRLAHDVRVHCVLEASTVDTRNRN